MQDTTQALRIRLDTQAQGRRPLPPSWTTLYAGGRGLAAKLIAELPQDIAPLAPENPLIVAPGMLHGALVPGAAGIMLSALSPLTGVPAYSWAEGGFGNALQRAGVSLLIIAGVAAEWSMLVITPEGAEVTPCPELCGLDTDATTKMLRRMYGNGVHVLALGPAGEAGVAYAAPVVDGRYLAEPAGVGAVMAAKRLKAIVVQGGQTRPVKDRASLHELERVLEQRCSTFPLAVEVRRFGSAAYINWLNDQGAATARNGQDATFLGMLALSRSTLALRGKQEAHGDCPLHCYAEFTQRDGSPLPRPDMEALLGFGVRCGVADLEAVLLMHQRCVQLGLDVSATSAAIAFLMECQQQGLHRTPAIPWGHADIVLDLVEKIGRKEGVGGVLSLGVGEMQSIFWGSEKWAPQAHGGALSPIDPRALPIIALHAATSTWSGDYRMALPLSGLLPHQPEHLPQFGRPSDEESDVARLLWHERFAAALDALGICRRWGLLAYAITPTELAALTTYATGVAWTPAGLAKLGERVITLERVSMMRAGGRDTLPARWAQTPLVEGRVTRPLPNLKHLLSLYYAAHGWNTEGLPDEARLRSLDLVS
jgi:aldehyde:ferredoxin oxidoreductase